MIFGLSSEPILFVFGVTYTINVSLIPQLLLSKVCLYHYNQTICDNVAQHEKEQVEVQKEATLWAMIIFLCELVPAFFMVLMWGPLTDIFGRRKKLIYLTLAMGMQNLVLAFCAHFPDSSPAYIIISALAAGTYGSFSGVVMITYSFMADVTKDDLARRTKRMAILESCIYTSGVLSGSVSGHFVVAAGYTTVFLTNGGLTVILCLYVLILTSKNKRDQYENLSEPIEDENEKFSVSDENEVERNRSPKSSIKSLRYRDIGELNPFKLIKQVFKVIINNENRMSISLLMVLYFCSVCVLASDNYVIPLYLKNAPFNFNAEWVGYYIALFSGVGGTSLLVLSFISHCFYISDYFIILLGLISQVILYILTGIARGVVLLFVARAPCMFYTVPMPSIRSLGTKLISPKEYGAFLGALASIDILGFVFINFAGLGIYKFTIAIYSGFVFFVIAGISVIGIIILLVIYLFARKE